MILGYDPVKSLRHWPTPMARFGKVPGTQNNLYRIIFAPTRMHLVGGFWEDTGTAEYRWGRTYRSIGDKWVMERWVSAFEFALMGKKEWELKFRNPETGLLLQGPYPDKGEYQHCHTFEACDPGHANLEKLVMWIEAGRRNTHGEILKAVRDDYDADTKARRATCDAIIRNALPEHLGSTVGRYAARVGKSLPTPKTAEQLGLPTSPNKFITGSRKIPKQGIKKNARSQS